eukprot:gnl/Chilomastix_cuspidata/997.p2 GENE.gnl/Chilomastix_cuspidata/997~~gnl/Chilomastix_cuspidata/997.p2  ORF type:complete len:642 (+),score=317.55 gnl/Chilomastix_cuspidata/997:2735-4660(+)
MADAGTRRRGQEDAADAPTRKRAPLPAPRKAFKALAFSHMWEDLTPDEVELLKGPAPSIAPFPGLSALLPQDSSDEREREILVGCTPAFEAVSHRMPPLPGAPSEFLRALALDKDAAARFLAHASERRPDAPELSSLQRHALAAMRARADVAITCADTQEERNRLREATALHVASLLAERFRALRSNDVRLELARERGEELEIRDGGFTRPAVLWLAPTRHFAFRALELVLAFLPGLEERGVARRARFEEEFGPEPGATCADAFEGEDPTPRAPMPLAWRQLFCGNMDDFFELCLRVGKGGTRKVCLFSDRYEADLIVASPLALHLARKEGLDFLSSVGTLVVDGAGLLENQNWRHLRQVAAAVGATPAEDHGMDVTRLRRDFQDGNARGLLQTVVLGTHASARVNALLSSLRNRHGLVRLSRSPASQVARCPAGCRVVAQRIDAACVPPGLTVRAIRIREDQAQQQRVAVRPAGRREEYFFGRLIPSLVLPSRTEPARLLVVVPSVLDLLTLRSLLRCSHLKRSHAALTEDQRPERQQAVRRRMHRRGFDVLLVSERFFFFRRWKIRGVRDVVFYRPPANPELLAPLVGFCGNLQHGAAARGTAMLLFDPREDFIALVNAVGTEKARELVHGERAAMLLK